MPKDNHGEDFEFKSVLELVSSSQPIYGPRTRRPPGLRIGNPYGAIGQAQLTRGGAQYQCPQTQSSAEQLRVLPPEHEGKAIMPVAVPSHPWKPTATEIQAEPDTDTGASTTPNYRVPVFGSMPPSHCQLSLHASPAMLQSNGMISPVTPSLTPKPENSIRQQPIIFPLTPPSTAKYPRAGAPAKLSTIAECSTEDEKTPQSCRISPDRDFALTPTPTPTRIMAMMEEEKKGRVALYKEQVTQAKLRRERAKKGT